MKVICSYCRVHTGDKEPLDDDAVSHGMCGECFDHFDHQLAGLALEDYLEGFRAPVIIVNHEGRIAAANNTAADMMNKPPREVFGLLGGEAMECMYARLPEGCGQTVHCETCTIRNTVMHTLNTRETLKNTRVTLRQASGDIDMLVSTDYIDGMVRIVIGKVIP